MVCRKTLTEVNPDWLVNGIFTAMQNFDIPWKDLQINTFLDIEYYGNNSGNKLISPLVDKLLNTDEELTQNELVLLARVIFTLNGVNWSKVWSTLSLNYNPIENYSMIEVMTNDQKVIQFGRTETRTDNLTHTKEGTETETPNTTETRTDNLTHTKEGTETETPNTTETRTDNLTHTKEGTETETPNTTETQTPDLNNTKSESRYGFNSSDAVPANIVEDVSTGTNTIEKTGTDETEYDLTETQTGTQTTVKTGTDETEYDLTETQTGTQTTVKTGTDETEYDLTETQTGTQTIVTTGTNETEYDITETQTGTQGNVSGGSDTETRNYRLTRSGNIGVTTSQQMLESERLLWVWNFFRDVVFPDVDKVLTINIY